MEKSKKKKIWERLREMIAYVVVGVMTTSISLGVYYLFLYAFQVNYQISNVISWISAVTFAFFMNRKFVFRSDGNIPKQIVLFFGVRLFALAVEQLSLTLAVEVIGFGKGISKIGVQAIVMVVNYTLSKLIVFRKKKKEQEQQEKASKE